MEVQQCVARTMEIVNEAGRNVAAMCCLLHKVPNEFCGSSLCLLLKDFARPLHLPRYFFKIKYTEDFNTEISDLS